jgi:hypothetical protein
MKIGIQTKMRGFLSNLNPVNNGTGMTNATAFALVSNDNDDAPYRDPSTRGSQDDYVTYGDLFYGKQRDASASLSMTMSPTVTWSL